MAAKADVVVEHSRLLKDAYKNALDPQTHQVDKDPEGVKRKLEVVKNKALVLGRGIDTVREKRLSGLPIYEDDLA